MSTQTQQPSTKLTSDEASGAHTPGPWRVGKARYGEHWANIHASAWEGFARVVVRMEGDDHDQKDGIANARLIAAAPELLAGAKAILAARSSQQSVDAVIQLRDAIAKAEGRS